MKTERFQEIFNIVEPILIKEGDKRVYLGINKVPAKYDCRVVWDVLYQKMIAKIEELENEVKDLQIKLENKAKWKH